MGQASGGMAENIDRHCFCLVDMKNRNVEMEKWIPCKGCKTLFHQLCNFVSDEEYDRIIGDEIGWYCSGLRCQELERLAVSNE